MSDFLVFILTHKLFQLIFSSYPAEDGEWESGKVEGLAASQGQTHHKGLHLSYQFFWPYSLKEF